MTYSKTKDFIARKFIHQHRVTKCLLKSLRSSPFLNTYSCVLWNNSRYYTLRNHWVQNHCIITGKTRGIVKKFKLSRHQFKFYANQGLLYSIQKASW